MGICISEPKPVEDKRVVVSNKHETDGGRLIGDVIDHSNSLTIVPGDMGNLGYLMHEVIVRNNVQQCARLLTKGFPIDIPLKYSSSVPVTTALAIDKTNKFEFCGTALHVACIYRRPAIVDLLMLHKANPNVIDRFDRTPIVLTVTYWPRVAFMNADNKGYAETVMKSFPKKSQSCLESLCLNGADVNKKFGNAQETPLHLASRYHIASCARVLIKFGANVNATDIKGMTPLHYACKRFTTEKDDFELISILLENGADVNSRDSDGNCPLHVASRNGCCRFVSELIFYGADPELKNDRDVTSLSLLLDCESKRIDVKTINVLLNECTYFRIFDTNYRLPSLLRRPEFSGIRKSLSPLATDCPRLARICRQLIRKTIGVRNIRSDVVDKLPIPVVMRNEIVRQIDFTCEMICNDESK